MRPGVFDFQSIRISAYRRSHRDNQRKLGEQVHAGLETAIPTFAVHIRHCSGLSHKVGITLRGNLP